MPGKVDERLWEEAKKQAAKQGKEDNYAYITGIYQKMSGEKAMKKSISKNNIHVDLVSEEALLDALEKGMDIGGQAHGLKEDGRHRLLGMRNERMEKGVIAGGTVFHGEFDAHGSRGADHREEVARAQTLDAMISLDEAGNKGNGGLMSWFEDAYDPEQEQVVPVGMTEKSWIDRGDEPIEIYDDSDPYNQALNRLQPGEHGSSIREKYQKRDK